MRILSFLLLLITGLALALPGLYLASLGGSLYYAVAGLLILLSGFLVLRRRIWGLCLYWAVLLATIGWSLWEVGLDGWALMPRLVFLSVGALWLLWLTPFDRPISFRRRALASLVLIGGLVMLLGVGALRGSEVQAALPASAGTPAVNAGDWSHWGKSLSGTRYSQLDQITPANADRLEQAWTFHAGLFGRDKHSAHAYETTPLMVDGMLYGCTPHSAVFALDPVTGKEIWRHDTKIDMSAGGRGVCRGVSFFRAPEGTAECATRILLGTVDNKLIAVDAKTGQSCRSFGKDGAVDLTEGLGLEPATRGWTNPTSPPAIVHGTAVIGAYIIDNASTRVPPGVIRGFDAVTGALKWVFDPDKPDDHAPLPPGGTYTPSTPNSWTVFSGDEALGLVYVPMGNGSPDYYGPHRTPQNDRFSVAVVALDADTGAVRWTFQAVHHDLWDYDLAAQPVLTDLPTANGTTPVLIQPTKTGQLFVLDRRTGKPVKKVEERLVPASTIPGERASPTQPYSTGMPDFAGPALTEADMWGTTPFDQLYCRIRFRQASYHGMFTPLRFGSSVRTPGELGGIDWGSVALDEGRGVLVVNSNLMADWDELISRAQADREHLFTSRDPRSKDAPGTPHRGAAMEGTPYGLHFDAFMSPLGVPCQRPPYGFISAVELKTGKLLWQHRFGDASNSGPLGHPLGLPFGLGAPNIGGSLVTRGGVIFIGASQDQHFRAIDEASGKTLWQVKLPAGGHANPMTYLGRDGKQYVLIAAGGQGSFRTGTGDGFIAYRLK
jgi:quinoprotein glucose dehydrogenase